MQYFRLRDIYYSINNPTVKINRNENISLDVTFNGMNCNTKEKQLKDVNLEVKIPYELTNLYDVENKTVKLEENAGNFIINSKIIPIEMSKITIREILDSKMIIHWSGEITLPYNKQYGKHTPFDMEFSANMT